MQSADYVPGISGWKIHDHVRLVINDGNRRIHAEVKLITTAGPGLTNDQAAQQIRDLAVEQSSRVTCCEGSVIACGSQVAAQGAPTAAQGHAISSPVHAINNTISSEASARVSADDALTTHIGALTCNLQDHRADTSATCFLTTRVVSAEDSKLETSSSKPVESLILGGVTFYRESARAIRDVQEVLRAAGAGQLEVVKRDSQGEKPFVVDARAVITKATVESAAIDPSSYSLKVAMGDDGRFYIAGVGIGVSTVASELNLGPSLEKDVRRLLREELQPGGILHRH